MAYRSTGFSEGEGDCDESVSSECGGGTAWTGSKAIRPFIPPDVAAKSVEEIEQWAVDYTLRLLDLCAELGVKVVPMFWGVLFGWEMATGYPWGFWKSPTGDINMARFVEQMVKVGYPAAYRRLMGTQTAPLVVEAESAYRELDATSANGIEYVRDQLCGDVATASFEDGMGEKKE